jgi:predicted ribosomally synthesized peptide with SipW-like signal peptide
MKNVNGDKLVKDKVQSLDTLSGGIVYGKEEAWEKLQARMDRKPAKKIAIRYWLAAAAVLLLFAGATTAYFYPAKQVTNIAVKEQIKAPINNKITLQQPATNIIAPPEKMAVHTIASSVNKVSRKPKTIIKPTTEQPEIIAIQNTETALTENKKEVVAVNNTPPVTPILQPMKVVHINDIENGRALQTKPQPINAGPSVVINKLPVVHINDVERESVEGKAKTILHENRMSYEHIPFYNSSNNYDDVNSNTEEYHQPLNFLKRKLNIQN